MPTFPYDLSMVAGPGIPLSQAMRARMIQEEMARQEQAAQARSILPPPKMGALPPMTGEPDQTPLPWAARLFGGDPGLQTILGPAAMRGAGSRGLLDAGLAMMSAAGGNGSGFKPGLGEILQRGMQAGQSGFQGSVAQASAERQAAMQGQMMQARQDAFSRHPEQPGETLDQSKRRLLSIALDLSQAGDSEGAQHIMSMIAGGAFNEPTPPQGQHLSVEDETGQYLIPVDRSGFPRLDTQGNPIRIKLAGPKPSTNKAQITMDENRMKWGVATWNKETAKEQEAWDALGQLRDELTAVPGSAVSGATIVAALGRMAAPNNAREVQFISRLINGSEDQGAVAQILHASGLSPHEKIKKLLAYWTTPQGLNIPDSVKMEFARLGDALIKEHGLSIGRKERIMRNRWKEMGVNGDEGMAFLNNPYADNGWKPGYLEGLLKTQKGAQAAGLPDLVAPPPPGR